jgi:hypothetical protein
MIMLIVNLLLVVIMQPLTTHHSRLAHASIRPHDGLLHHVDGLPVLAGSLGELKRDGSQILIVMMVIMMMEIGIKVIVTC